MPTSTPEARETGASVDYIFEPGAPDAVHNWWLKGLPFPTVQISPIGEVRVGDGTAAPLPIGNTGGGTNLGSLVQFVVAADSTNFASISGSNVRKCDGVADQTEINAAITAASLVGGFVQLSDGHFHCTAPVLMAGNITFQGRNRRSTVLVADQAMGFGLGVFSSVGAPGPITNQVRQWRASEFSIDGGGFNTPTMYLSWTNSVELTGFQLKNSTGQGMFMQAFWDSEISDYRIDACGSQAATTIGNTKASMEFFGTSVGDNCNNLVFRRGTIEHTPSALSDMAIKMVSGSTANEQHNKITFDQFKVEHHTVGNVPVIYAQGAQWVNFDQITLVVGDFMALGGITNTPQDAMLLKNCTACGVSVPRIDIQVSAHQTTNSAICFDGGADCYVHDIKIACQPSNYPQKAVVRTINAPARFTCTNYGYMFDGTAGVVKYFSDPLNDGQKTSSEPGRMSKYRSTRGGQGPSFITASTTLTGDAVVTNLSVQAYEAGLLRMVLIYSADTVPDFKFQLTAPTNAHLYYTLVNPNGLDITGGAGEGVVYTEASVVSLAGVTAVGTKRMVIIQGSYEIGDTPGNVNFLWAQNTSDAGKAQVELGTRLVLEAV